MPSQYNGLPANVSPPGTLNIAGSTNATPIELTTTTPHGISPGDSVHVIGHELNTGANGIHSVTVTGLSSFTLDGTAGTAVGLATGTVQNLVMGATIPIPSDGDDFNGATLGVGNIGIADRTAALGLWTGAAKLANRVVLVNVDPTIPPAPQDTWATFTGATIHSVPTAMTSAHPLTLLGLPGGTFNVQSLSIPFQIGGICAGDVIEARLEAVDGSNLPNNWINLWCLYGAIAPPAVTPAFPANYSLMSTPMPILYDGFKLFQNVITSGFFPTGGSPGVLWVVPTFIPYIPYVPESMTCILKTNATLTIEVWRPTGMPQ